MCSAVRRTPSGRTKKAVPWLTRGGPGGAGGRCTCGAGGGGVGGGVLTGGGGGLGGGVGAGGATGVGWGAVGGGVVGVGGCVWATEGDDGGEACAAALL